MILNIHLSQKVTNEVLYGVIEKISTKTISRFLKFAGHYLHRDDEVVSELVLWGPTHGTRRREGHQKATSGISSAKLVYRRAR